MTEIQLRPYQQNFIDNVRNEFRQGHKRVVGVAPCGAGKTIMTGWMIRQALERGKKSLFFVHRHELIEQTAKTFTALNIPHGIIAAGIKPHYDLPVQIASVQTLAARRDNIHHFDFLICDECHHILANTYKKILDKFPSAYLLGVTATPQRLGGINLGDIFTSMVQSVSVNQLIALGNLTKFQYFAPDSHIDLSGVASSFGEFNQRSLARAVDKPEIIGDIVKNYCQFAHDKTAICYCVNVEHSKEVALAFKNAGIPAAHIDADTPPAERKFIVNAFRHDQIKVLCNVELFGEGFDVPHCQAVILARPTQSLTLFIQQAMRPLRPDPNDPNKVAVIIDHVLNCNRHGLPNEIRQWSLEPNNTGKQCPCCQKWIVPVIKNGKKICPKCGFEFPKGESLGYAPRIRDARNGNIAEIEVNFSDKKKIDAGIIHVPTTVEEFMVIAQKRRYKKGWVAYKALEHADNYKDCLHIAEICGYQPGWAWHQWQELKTAKQKA